MSSVYLNCQAAEEVQKSKMLKAKLDAVCAEKDNV